MNGHLLFSLVICGWIIAINTTWIAYSLSRINARAEYQQDQERRKIRKSLGIHE